MKKTNQIERILQILSWLAMGEKLTAKIVEKKLDYKASRRDIQRDFWHIFDAQLPISYEEKGREKIWFFDNKAYADKLAPMFQNRSEL
jgi:predicted DNA-binding transcriptional regulator YafY